MTSIQTVYQKKDPIEHVLIRPDTYIGSVEPESTSTWLWDSQSQRMVYRECTFVPAILKIVDEILVNAADQHQRYPKEMTQLKVDLAQDHIQVWNNGPGIPVDMHHEHKCHIPELIFGNLRTGSNFDDKQKKTTGGRNGLGSKVSNIFSTKFTIGTVDDARSRDPGCDPSDAVKQYSQTWTTNMG